MSHAWFLCSDRLVKCVNLVFRSGCLSEYKVDCGRRYCVISLSSAVKSVRIFLKVLYI